MPDQPRSQAPLDAFIQLYWEDYDRGKVPPLSHYLRLFPQAEIAIAREYLALEGHQKAAAHGTRRSLIGHYRVVRELGGGGQGIVYLARDLKLERDVAIKRLQGTYSLDKVERFRREARIASRLDHPGICPIYEIGDQDGDPYFVMRYVEGVTLAAKIGSLKSSAATTFTFVEFPDDEESADPVPTPTPSPTPTPRPVQAPAGPAAPAAKTPGPTGALVRTPSKREVNAVLRLVEQVARALHEAHEAGVVHRDVKPANIMVAKDGQPVLLDFGLATMTHGEGIIVTDTGETPGTPAYMSPEQLAGGKIPLDRRTDVYSLGVTLFECLTLTRPFEPTTQVARRILFLPPPDPRQYNAAISQDLRTVLEVALDKDRDRRYQTAAELADELRRVRENQPIIARRAGPIKRVMRWTQRNPVVAASLLCTFVTLVAGLIVSLRSLGEAKAAAASELEKTRMLDRELTLSEPTADLQRVTELSAWSDRLWPIHPTKVDGDEGMEGWLKAASELLERRPKYDAAFLAISDPAAPFNAEERKQRERVLKALTEKLAKLPEDIAGMQQRKEKAETLQKRTVDHHQSEWNRIAVDLGRDPAFASVSPFKAQTGLIPLGRNPQGYEEFVVSESGDVPRRQEDGTLEMTEESGIMLVLLPGGPLTFLSRPRLFRPDPEYPRKEIETPIEPFFIGKHEVTQGQWLHIYDRNPANARPGAVTVPMTLTHPVESVGWSAAQEFCHHLGLELPTQDQWEIAARGKLKLYWGDCPDVDCLQDRENLADASYKQMNPEWTCVAWNDGYRLHAPVGTFQPNRLGLYDMLGNISEWCLDRYRLGRRVPSLELAQIPPELDKNGEPVERRRVFRGGNYQAAGNQAECSWFGSNNPEGVQPTLGFRVVRAIER